MIGIPVRKGDIVIDLGANRGLFSRYCLERGASVHAYEPHPQCFARLKELQKTFPNLMAYNEDVSLQSGKASLHLHENHDDAPDIFSESSSLIAEKANVGSHSVEVKVTSISEILEQFERIRLIKIDIEGSEYDIYPALIDFSDRIDNVFMEPHLTVMPNRREDDKAMRLLIEEKCLSKKFNLDWF